VKLSIKSQIGKEAILDILSGADFVGKDSIAGQSFRTASASAITDCTLLRISNEPMLVALARHLKLANLFWAYVLVRNIRYQQDLVDQHCNPSEKRLARILLLLAHYDGHGPLETTVPQDKSRDTGRNGRHYSLAHLLFHEQVQEIGLHLLRAQRQDAASPSDTSCFLRAIAFRPWEMKANRDCATTIRSFRAKLTILLLRIAASS
jgi:CRP-like cAMP-binding protein